VNFDPLAATLNMCDPAILHTKAQVEVAQPTYKTFPQVT